MRLPFALTLTAAAVVAGCAHAPVGAPNQDATSSASVVGVIYLPEGLSEAEWCRHLSVEAAAQGTAVGRVNIRTSRGRCAYEVSRLPSGEDIAVTVKLPACPSGGTASLAPPLQPVKLRDHETRTQDFRASCAS